MSKKPGFFKKIKEKNEEKRTLIKEKMAGVSYLYMGDPQLHWGAGGWIRGHLNLIYGPSRSGKTAICLRGCAEEQKLSKGYVIIVDTEWAYADPDEVDLAGNPTPRAQNTIDRLRKAGLDPDKTLIWQSNIATDAFSLLSSMETDLQKDPSSVSAILIDSWGGIQGEAQREKLNKGKADDAGKSYGGNAKVINPIIQHLVRMANVYGVTVFGVQHATVNLEQYGPKFLLPGGQKLLHLNHCIMFIEGSETKGNSLLDGDEAGSATSDMAGKVGKLVRFRCEKSRVHPEGRNGAFYMNFSELTFAMPEQSLFDLASRLGVIVHPTDDKGKQNQSWWQFPENAASPHKWHGQKGAVKALKEDKQLYEEILAECLNLNGNLNKPYEGIGVTDSSDDNNDEIGKVM